MVLFVNNKLKVIQAAILILAVYLSIKTYIGLKTTTMHRLAQAEFDQQLRMINIQVQELMIMYNESIYNTSLHNVNIQDHVDSYNVNIQNNNSISYISDHNESHNVKIQNNNIENNNGFSDVNLVPTATMGIRSKTTNQNQESVSTQTCTRRNHVYYLKTHKTGSTTVSNILFRYGLRKQLYVVTFTTKKQGLGIGPLFRKAVYVNPHPQDIDDQGQIRAGPPHKYDLQLEHTIFSEDDVYRLMPQDTVFVATVRHPFHHLKSTFNHYHMDQIFEMPEGPDPVERFLENPYIYQNHPRALRVRNKMIYEFGMNMTRTGDEAYVAEFLDYLVQTFHSVLITEYIDASLVLLKRRLCWGTQDIVYFAQRNQSYEGKYRRPEEYGALYDNHRGWTPIDYQLYEMFLAKFHTDVQQQGPGFQTEVTRFKQILQQIRHFCEDFQEIVWNRTFSDEYLKQAAASQYLPIRSSPFTAAFTVTGMDCIQMRLGHTTMRYATTARQYGSHCGDSTFPVNTVPEFCKTTHNQDTFIQGNFPMDWIRRRPSYLA